MVQLLSIEKVKNIVKETGIEIIYVDEDIRDIDSKTLPDHKNG